MNQIEETEEQKTSQLMLVIMAVAFSTILIVLNILMEWEMWTIPLLAAVVPATLVMHILRKPDIVQRTNIYTVILMVEMFYYTSQIEKIYDGCGVVIVMLVLFTTTQKRLLIWVSWLIGNLGLILHLIQAGSEDALSMTHSSIVRTVWCFVIVFIAALVTDRIVVVHRRSLERFERQIQISEEVNRSAGDFLANVSHEIRTPINAVIGLSGVCIERESDADIRIDLDSIRDAGKRVAEQVSDILDYSEIDRKRLAVNKEDYMISSVLNDIVLELRPYLTTDLELVIDVAPEVPSMMNTDVTKLKKILWHLIMNGLKYTKQGGVYVRITTRPKPYGVNLFIEVEDTGVGMDDLTMEKIFDRFYQSDSGRTRSSSGLGLGMSIVAGFVHTLGGFITIDSKREKGTVVHVSLPQVVVDNTECMSVKNPKELRVAGFLHFEKFPHPQVREYYNSTVRNIVRGLGVTLHRVENAEDLRKLVSETDFTHLFVGEEEYNTDPGLMEELSKKMIVEVVTGNRIRLPRGSRINIMKKPFYCFPVTSALNMYWNLGDEEEGRLYCPGVRALVVDDEPMNLTVALGVFRGYGMVVETAESGMESIEMCRENKYDIIFMDHMMPGMDGVEAMKRLRIECGRQNRVVPIVALTANAVSSAKEMFLREGFDGFVSKPIEILELERVLKHVLPKDSIRYEERKQSNSDVLEFSPRISENESYEKPIQDNVPDSAQDLSALEAYDIDIATGMRYCQDDQEFYKQLLTQFASESDKKKKGMKESLEKKAYADYSIYVHALKSTAKMIGAAELSERAKKLEEAAKAEDGSYIESSQDELLKLYEKTITGIRLVCEIGNPDNASSDKPDDDAIEFEPVTESKTGGLSEAGDDEVIEFAPKGGVSE
ncbi:MAG: response regulator [Eubacterium sp.]|nr:response regulator [Eubacterium sp.]